MLITNAVEEVGEKPLGGGGVNPIQTGFFLCFPGPGGLRRPYACNSTTAYGMAPKFTRNDVLNISII